MTFTASHRFLPEVCIVCSHPHLDIVDRSFILGRYSAELVACQRCGHEWFQSPGDWLEEAYASPIANTDTGIVARSLNIHRILSSFLCFSNDTGKILDWGSGSGLLTRLLRDDGFDCIGLEPYTDPVLASRFTLRSQMEAIHQGPYRAVIAIEVVEHLASPQEFFKQVLSLTDTLVFSTEIVDRPRYGNDWCYYSKETGQHISFFTHKSLSYLADLYSCNYASARNKGLHIITRKSSDLQLFWWIAGPKRGRILYPLSQILQKISGRHSLIMKDHLSAREILLSAQANRSE